MQTSTIRRAERQLEPRNLRGIPGYIYILKNSGLKDGIICVGLSRRGGWAKALELNRDKNNAIPGSFDCVFEIRAQDSGASMESILKIIEHARQGRAGQDFFELDSVCAQHIVERCVQEADRQFQGRFQQDIALREFQEVDGHGSAAAINDNLPRLSDADKPIREGIFKKALGWLS